MEPIGWAAQLELIRHGAPHQLADQAVAVADHTDALGSKARALANVAAALAALDPIHASQLKAQAVAAADRIAAPFDREKTFADIAATLVVADPGRALVAADRINNPVQKAQALADMSAALSRCRPDRTLTDRIDTPSREAEALSPAPTDDEIPVRLNRRGLIDEFLTRLRALNPAIGHGAWWNFAHLLVTLETGAPECDNLVKAVLAADEW